jgi:hypothetical protein
MYIFLAFLWPCAISDVNSSVGPVAQYHENSRYYSAVAPEPNPEVDSALPVITIELPVFKESLEQTMYVHFLPFIIHSTLFPFGDSVLNHLILSFT